MQNRNYEYYNQGDPRWKTNPLGVPRNENDTIGRKGCAICCIGMIIHCEPDALNDFLTKNKGYDENKNVVWQAVDQNPKFQKKITFKGKKTVAEIKDSFDQGLHVILFLKIRHFVLMTGYNGDSITVLDPGHKTRSSYDISKIDSARIYQ